MKNTKEGKEKIFFTDSDQYPENFGHCEFSEEDIKEIEALEAVFPIEIIEKMVDKTELKQKYARRIKVGDKLSLLHRKTNNIIIVCVRHLIRNKFNEENPLFLEKFDNQFTTINTQKDIEEDKRDDRNCIVLDFN